MATTYNSYFKPMDAANEANTSMRLINEQGQNALNRYTTGVTADMNNALAQGYQTVRQQMANQGLLSSTAAGTAMGRQYQQVSSPFLQSIAGARTEYQNNQRSAGDQAALLYQQLQRGAREEGRADRSFAENVRQFGLQKALELWELQESAALSQKQLGISDKKIKWPAQPKSFAELFSQKYLAPESSTGPVGDPKEYWPSYTQDLGSTLAERTESRMAADADADRNLAERRLAAELEQNRWARDIYRPEDDETDPRVAAFNSLLEWRMGRYAGTDPKTGAPILDPNSASAEEMAAIIQGAYGIDPAADPQMAAILGLNKSSTLGQDSWMTRPTGATRASTRGGIGGFLASPVGAFTPPGAGFQAMDLWRSLGSRVLNNPSVAPLFGQQGGGKPYESDTALSRFWNRFLGR